MPAHENISHQVSEGLLGVVVVNFASIGLLERAVEDLPLERVRLIVVDNFSDAREREKVRQRAAEYGWILVEMAGNRGFGPAINAGVARAKALSCECFLLLNPDIVVSAETVEALRLAVLLEPRALVSPCLTDTQGQLTFVGSVLDLRDGRVRRGTPDEMEGRWDPPLVPWLTAACLAVNRQLWDEVGGMSEEYFMYWEDVDFSVRARAIGARMVVRRELRAIHDQGGTQGVRRGRAKSSLYYHYNIRNRLLFASLHLSRRPALRWLLSTPVVSWEILLRGGRRQLVENPKLALSAWRGMWAGLKLRSLREAGRDQSGRRLPRSRGRRESRPSHQGESESES